LIVRAVGIMVFEYILRRKATAYLLSVKVYLLYI